MRAVPFPGGPGPVPPRAHAAATNQSVLSAYDRATDAGDPGRPAGAGARGGRVFADLELGRPH
jgi:hypothetical protein